MRPLPALLAVLVLVPAAAASAAPVNDVPDAATVIGAPAYVSGSTVDARRQGLAKKTPRRAVCVGHVGGTLSTGVPSTVTVPLRPRRGAGRPTPASCTSCCGAERAARRGCGRPHMRSAACPLGAPGDRWEARPMIHSTPSPQAGPQRPEAHLFAYPVVRPVPRPPVPASPRGIW
ncbi:hypothetical protein FSW04_23930 [Baekduia soli]|uniref:Uncharacterized protein n=1 Tax=Baekduia soli TaxID=496014 RepID=A0A5B8UBC3_9ACTN|nr:hypothetical protein [Baekduia soli]QEC50330.1 hypothetical protein FSW04_23930 [Baekduia soli]